MEGGDFEACDLSYKRAVLLFKPELSVTIPRLSPSLAPCYKQSFTDM